MKKKFKPFYLHNACDHDGDLTDTAACEIDSGLAELRQHAEAYADVDVMRMLDVLDAAWEVLTGVDEKAAANK